MSLTAKSCANARALNAAVPRRHITRCVEHLIPRPCTDLPAHRAGARTAPEMSVDDYCVIDVPRKLARAQRLCVQLGVRPDALCIHAGRAVQLRAHLPPSRNVAGRVWNDATGRAKSARAQRSGVQPV